MDVEEGIRKGIRAQPRPAPPARARHLLPRLQKNQASLQDQDHGVGGAGSSRQPALRQGDLPQESAEDHSPRSIVALCGELHRHPVFLRRLHPGHELWEEEPGVQTQSQHGLAGVSQ